MPGVIAVLILEGGNKTMCDYSLMAIPNRLAVPGEELIVHRFEAGSIGLASAFDLRRIQECRKAQFRGVWPTIKAFFIPSDSRSIPAVCIPPGARLLISDIPAKLQRECGFQDDVQEAVFTQVTSAVNTFRDAVRFQNSVEVLLQRFEEGQRVRVLDLSLAEEQETGPREQRRVMA
jgi:hypothetical protein